MGTDGIAVFSRDVTKVFGRGDTQVHALRGIDLNIRLGELTMLVGPSGSGKTTLLSVITGLLDATSGDPRHRARSRRADPFSAREFGLCFPAIQFDSRLDRC